MNMKKIPTRFRLILTALLKLVTYVSVNAQTVTPLHFPEEQM